MAEGLLIGLFVLSIVMAFITVTGHLMWLLLGAIGRALFGGSRTSLESACPQCGDRTGLVQGVCEICGYQSRAARIRELQSAVKSLRDLRATGGIAQDPCDSAIEALQTRVLQLQGAAVAKATAPRTPSAATAEPQQPAADSDAEIVYTSEVVPPSAPAAASPFATEGMLEAEILEADIVQPPPIAPPAPVQAVHPLDAPEADVAEEGAGAPAFSPRRTLANMLQSFMEEKNIRWGELASGMLIVGSAIGLVVSLRPQLEQLSRTVRYFPGFLLMLGTVAIHLAGLYTLRRWKLRSTSRGVLIIATLLVPLSFAAGIRLSGTEDQLPAVGSLTYLVAVVVGLLGYGSITWLSARALFPEGWWRLTLAVMGTAAGQLVIHRLADHQSSTELWFASALFAAPLVSYLTANFAQLRILGARSHLTPTRATQTFTLLGVSCFSLAVPLVLQVSGSSSIRQCLAALSPSLCLTAAMVLAVGVAVQRRSEARSMGETRMVGTALALLGGMAMLGAMVAAWPIPIMLIAAATVTAIILALLAAVGRLPVLHAGVAAAASFACLLLYHHATGQFAELERPRSMDLVRALVMGRSSLILMIPAGLSALAGVLLWHKRARLDALAYLCAAGGIATASLGIALYAGFAPAGQDANWSTVIFALYALAALVVVPLLRRPESSWVAAAALLVTAIHTFCFNSVVADLLQRLRIEPQHPYLISFILSGLIISIYSLVLELRRDRTAASETEPPVASQLLGDWVQTLAAAASALTVFCVPFVAHGAVGDYAEYGAYALGIALVWGIGAVVMRQAALATAAHVAATFAIMLFTAAVAQRRDWQFGMNDARHWLVQLAVLGLWCLLSIVLRTLAERRLPRARALLATPWPSFDQLLLPALILCSLGVGLAGCWPDLTYELGISNVRVMADEAWHGPVFSSFGWWAFACLTAAVLASFAQGVSATRLTQLVGITAVVPTLVSGHFADAQSVASALRWTCGGFTLIWIAVLALRDPIHLGLQRLFGPAARFPSHAHHLARDAALGCGLVVVVVLTTLSMLQVSNGVALNGPLPDTLFGRLDPLALYALPLLLIIIATSIVALRDGSSQHAFLGALLLQYSVTLSLLMTMPPSQYWTTGALATLLQWNACAVGGYALAWQLLSRWVDRHTLPDSNWPLAVQICGTALALAVLAVWPAAGLVWNPGVAGPEAAHLGLWLSYLAAGLGLASIGWYFRRRTADVVVTVTAGGSLLTVLAAMTAQTRYSGVTWLGYHVLTGGHLALLLVGTGLLYWNRHRPLSAWSAPISRAANVIAVAIFVLLLRGCVHDPIAAWWTLGISVGLLLYLATRAWSESRAAYTYGSAVVSLFATTVAWCHLTTLNDEQFLAGLVYANVIAASVTGIIWLALYLRQDRQGDSTASTAVALRWTILPVHSFLAVSATVVLGLTTLGGEALSILLNGDPLVIANPWGVAAWSVLGLLLAGTLWDRRIGLNLVASYAWGIVAIALVLNYVHQLGRFGSPREASYWMLIGGEVALAAYVALTGHLWKWGANLARWAARLQIPAPVAKLEQISLWLPTVNVLLTPCICALGFLTIFAAEDRAMRVTTAFAPLLAAYGMSCLAQRWRTYGMQRLALLLVALGAVFIGWADVQVAPGDEGLLAYVARLLVVLAGMTLLYSLGLARWLGPGHSWYEAVRKVGVVLAISTLAALVMVLSLEVALFKKGVGAPIGDPEILAVTVMLFAFLVALLTMAILPGRDPLGLSEKGRQVYVYAAQLLAALLFAHIYLAKPNWFQFGIMGYWPYIVMGIAFASVAFAEFCYRQGWRVIAEPMQNTGGFLPILPALTAWAFCDPSEVSYPLTLFFGGLIYVFMSVSRRSLIAGIAAAVMGNGALWALLSDEGLRLTTQPQLWLIPPALSVLGASYLNRDRLSDNTLTAIRYICVMIIYLSSTGEMFMKLMESNADAPERWLRPLILTFLSVSGIFAGILLRVRAFLYLGASFLLMSIVGMVWNAYKAVGHVWPWWAFGISMGIFILVLFGLFEKHRQGVQQLIDRLRQWER